MHFDSFLFCNPSDQRERVLRWLKCKSSRRGRRGARVADKHTIVKALRYSSQKPSARYATHELEGNTVRDPIRKSTEDPLRHKSNHQDHSHDVHGIHLHRNAVAPLPGSGEVIAFPDGLKRELYFSCWRVTLPSWREHRYHEAATHHAVLPETRAVLQGDQLRVLRRFQQHIKARHYERRTLRAAEFFAWTHYW